MCTKQTARKNLASVRNAIRMMPFFYILGLWKVYVYFQRRSCHLNRYKWPVQSLTEGIVATRKAKLDLKSEVLSKTIRAEFSWLIS